MAKAKTIADLDNEIKDNGKLTDDGTALKQIAGDFPKRKTDKATFSKVE